MLLDIQNLTFSWFDEPLLKNISTSLSPGDIIQLKGENGAGKTTLLKLISGAIPHFSQGKLLSGDILINNNSIIANPPGHFFPMIAFVPSRYIEFFLFSDNLKQEILMTRAIINLNEDGIKYRHQQFCDIFSNMNALLQISFSKMEYKQKVLSLTYIYFLQGARLFLLDEAISNKNDEWIAFFELLKSMDCSAIFASHQFKNNTMKIWELKKGKI